MLRKAEEPVIHICLFGAHAGLSSLRKRKRAGLRSAGTCDWKAGDMLIIGEL
jgi:hypothetical protein